MTVVVTVCTANLCRSPLAQHVLQHAFDERGWAVEVRSTGTDVWPGSVVPRDWQGVAQQFGVDLSDHRAMSPQDVLGGAEVVLTMTADQLRAVAVADPQLTGRATTLGWAAHDLALHGRVVTRTTPVAVLRTPDLHDVDDPVGRPLPMQHAVAARIVSLCHAVVDFWPEGLR